jgi:hypothetical protein
MIRGLQRPGLQRPPQIPKPGAIVRALVTGVFLLLELPLLLPIIAGAALGAFGMRVRAVACRLRRCRD